ncbi:MULTISPECIES: hypothetical protein [Butyricimonas]|uniref:hypothetical protein n=1 Tax=Butyricimonas TaxID=574697 RepID=UPI0007FB23D3|nr:MULTISPECIES: hypothetical protein [Butyricimonas]
MKLTDKRFWKFEAMMLLCGLLVYCPTFYNLFSFCLDSRGVIILISLLPALCLYYSICGIPTWLLYKGNSWLKLAGYLYLISSLLIIVPLFIFLYDWNPETANMRPEGLPPSEGKYITNNELVTIITLVHSILPIISILISSYLSKRWIVNDKNHKNIIDSARRAVKGNATPNVRAIAMSYTNNQLILKCYLDFLPTEQDREMLSDMSGEIISDFSSDKIPKVKEECIFSEQPLSELDCLDNSKEL